MRITRVFYSSGPGNIIHSYHNWKLKKHDPTEVSITFSSQILDFCKDTQAEAYLVSTHAQKKMISDGAYILEHRPKPASTGARFHIAEVIYGLGLLRTALQFRAQVAIMDSGSTHYFVLTLFRLFGIRVISVLHNTLWPTGFPPRRPIPRFVLWLDRFFWRYIPTAAIAVSPECERQVNQVRGNGRYPIFQVRAQFESEYFARISPPPSHEKRPFQVMFIGRINRVKGVFDILQIAREIEDRHPGLVRWEICGRGPDLEELKQMHRDTVLDEVVNLRGWTSLEDLVDIYSNSHASIVPTRSSFTEGLAMTAAEAILAGRPLVTNPVVPALEIFRSACAEARTNDPESHRDAVLKFATEGDYYRAACAACGTYQAQFYDRNLGLTAVLKRALAPYL